jgi:acyl carrier protein
MTIAERVKDIVVQQFGGEITGLTEKTHFENDLLADSLDVMEVIMEIEEEFDIYILDEDVDEIKTVGDLIEYVEKKLETE